MRLLNEAYATACPSARPGLILFVQTFGDLVNFHPHAHVLAPDGVFGPDGTFVFLPPVPEELLREGFRQAVLQFLAKEWAISDQEKSRFFPIRPYSKKLGPRNATPYGCTNASLTDAPRPCPVSRLRAFGDRKRDALPRCCRECEVLYQCHGGCPKDRLARAPDGEEGVNHLCAGFKRFFTHCGPYLQRMAQARRSGVPMAAFMSALRSEDTKAAAQAGRNDPCPCGSRKKYKRCCLAN